MTELDNIIAAGAYRVLPMRETLTLMVVATVYRESGENNFLFISKNEATGHISDSTLSRGLNDLEERGLLTRSYYNVCGRRAGPPDTYIKLNFKALRELKRIRHAKLGPAKVAKGPRCKPGRPTLKKTPAKRKVRKTQPDPRELAKAIKALQTALGV